MNNHAFTISFAFSLALHLTLLAMGRLSSLRWLRAPTTRPSIEVIYESQMAQQELRRLQEQLARSQRDLAAASPTANPLSGPAQVRIPDRPSLLTDHMVADLAPGRSAVVDLTNLVDAARGDPILLSYFGAIREQIQRTANHRSWLTEARIQGLVYVSFVLAPSGGIEGIKVLPDRSVPAQPLWDVALRIVRAAAPFPPFPPSISEPQKTVVVPLEFLFDS